MHDDLLSLLGKVGFSRREFVVTSLATGFALSVQPVSAETITTDAITGMRTIARHAWRRSVMPGPRTPASRCEP